MQLILRGGVKSYDEVRKAYSAPFMIPFRDEAYKTFGEYKKAQDVLASSGIDSLRMGFVRSPEFRQFEESNPVMARSAEQYLISSLLDYKSKHPDADAKELTEAFGKSVSQVRQDYMGSTKKEDAKQILTYGEQLRNQIDTIKDATAQAKIYNSQVVERAAKQADIIGNLDSYLRGKDISPSSPVAKDLTIGFTKKLRNLAEATQDPEAIEGAKAIQALSAFKFNAKEATTSSALYGTYSMAATTNGNTAVSMRLPQIDSGIVQLLLEAGNIQKVTEVTGEEAFVVPNPDKAIKTVIEYTKQQIAATKRTAEQPNSK
jgi:hypothetical protein